MILETFVTGEQTGNCGSCGYQFSRKVLRGNNGDPILDSENRFLYTSEKIENPYGAVHIVGKPGTAQGHFEGNAASLVEMYSVPTEKDFSDNILPYITENKEHIEEATLSRLVDGKIERTNLLTIKTEE